MQSFELETAKITLFADDVFLISSHHNELVTAVAKCNSSKNMVINSENCELVFLTTYSHAVNWQTTIIVNNTRLHHNPQMKFLRITLARLLTFGPHIQNISTKVPARC